MNLKNCRAVIFDMDGVLVDSETLYKKIEQELFLEAGVSIDLEEHISYQGCSNPVMWERIKLKHGLAQSVDELVERTQEKVVNFYHSLPYLSPMAGISELLEFLKKNGVRMAVASSSTLDVIHIVLAKIGIAHYFEAIADSLEAGAGKPDPAIFLLAQAKLKLPKEQCIIIEDSTNGIKAALAAGIPCIAFNGPGAEHQDQSAADWIIHDFREIIGSFDH